MHVNRRANYRDPSRMGKLLPFVIALLFFPYSSKSQWVQPDSIISISQLKQEFKKVENPDSLNRKITIAGTANVASGLLHETYLQTYIQNDSAGISVFGYDIHDPIAVGDSVVVKGEMQFYFGQPELLVTDYKVYPDGGGTLEPAGIFQAFAHPKQYQGMLVEGTGIIKDKGYRFNGKYLMIAPSDTSAQSVMIYISNFHSLYQDFDFDTPGIGDEIIVTGVMAQYDPADPGNTTYKVFLRTADDFSYAQWPQYYYEVLAYILVGLIFIAVVWMVSLRMQVKRKTNALQQSLKEKELLLQEIHHRVKNNLAAISGLLELQSGTTENEEVHEALRESQSRITSMAMVHDKLYQSVSFKEIPMQSYLTELAESIQKMFSQTCATVDMKVEADGIALHTDQVIPLGLLVNELLVNAFKHAFKSRDDGIIGISMKQQGENVTLKVEDNGVGLPEDLNPRQSDSLGMLLIGAFADQLQAEKTVKNTPGACFIFEFPMG